MSDVTPESVRHRMQSAPRRIARVKRMDRLARGVITLGGLGIVASVLFIFLFILGEAWPLFRSATATATALPPQSGAPEMRGALAIGSDEYQRKLYGLTAEGFVLSSLDAGTLDRREPLPLPPGVTITAASRNASGSLLVAGTSDGHAALLHVRFQPQYEAAKLVDVTTEVRIDPLVEMDPQRRPLRLVDGREREGAVVLAAVADERFILVQRKGADETAYLATTLEVGEGETITHLRLGRTDRSPRRGNAWFRRAGRTAEDGADPAPRRPS